MDYTKVPRELIWKDKTDLDYFDVQAALSHENIYLQKLMDRPFMQTKEAPHYALRIFNNAHYICTLILMSSFPKLYLHQYFEIAKDSHPREIEWANHVMPATMALVYNLLLYNRNFFPEHLLMKAIWESFQDWDQKGSPQGKDDFCELVINDYKCPNIPLDPLSPLFILDALEDANADTIINGYGYVINAIIKLREREPMYVNQCFELVLEKLKSSDNEVPETIIEETENIWKEVRCISEEPPIKKGKRGNLIEDLQDDEDTDSVTSSREMGLERIINEQKTQIDKLMSENEQLKKDLSEANETIDIPRLKIRIAVLNMLFEKLGYDMNWFTSNRKRLPLARVYAAILGHNKPSSIKEDVGKVIYVKRPQELDEEVAKINKLLADISNKWEVKL